MTKKSLRCKVGIHRWGLAYDVNLLEQKTLSKQDFIRKVHTVQCERCGKSQEIADFWFIGTSMYYGFLAIAEYEELVALGILDGPNLIKTLFPSRREQEANPVSIPRFSDDDDDDEDE